MIFEAYKNIEKHIKGNITETPKSVQYAPRILLTSGLKNIGKKT